MKVEPGLPKGGKSGVFIRFLVRLGVLDRIEKPKVLDRLKQNWLYFRQSGVLVVPW
jgi:hypothetical protein